MSAYVPRIEIPGAYYHVVTRGNNRRRIFDDESDISTFVLILTAAARSYGWTLVAYALMKNHYHLVIQIGTCDRSLSRGMCFLNTGYATEYNKRRGRKNHLFGKRYWSRLLKDDADLLTNCRYVELNPVRAGLVGDPGVYRWTSYRAHIGLALPLACLDADALLAILGDDRAAAISAWKKFVAEKLSEPVLSGPVWRQPP